MKQKEIEWKLRRIRDKFSLTNDDFQHLERMSLSYDSNIRYEAAELLMYYNRKKSIDLLFHLALDNDYLVRVQAYESLVSFPYKRVLLFLEKAANYEKNDLALANVIESWVFIVCARGKAKKKDYIFLKKLKKKKRVYKSERCILAVHFAEYMMGNKKSLKKISDTFHSKDYHIRCTVVHLFADIISYDNRKEIRKMLKEMRRKETTVAVKSTIDKLLNETA